MESPKAPGGLGEGEGFLGRGSPAPALICMLTEQGISPFFSVSKQPNFLQGDLRPHPGWGDRGSCQMSLRCSAPRRRSEGKSPYLGLSRAVGSPGHGQDPPQHPHSTGLVHSEQADPPSALRVPRVPRLAAPRRPGRTAVLALQGLVAATSEDGQFWGCSAPHSIRPPVPW